MTQTVTDDEIDALARCIEIQIQRNEQYLDNLPAFREGARVRARNAVTDVDELVS